MSLCLVEGRRLSRSEFERRWDATPELKHAELLDGVVYLRGDGRWVPASSRAELITWVGSYHAGTPCTTAGAHSSIRVDDANELQPNVALYTEHGPNRAVCDADDVLSSAPGFAADVVMRDKADVIPIRRRVHARFGTREYLVWRVEDEVVEWYSLRSGDYVALTPDPADGLLKSETFPGLWLDPAALVRGDLAAVLAALARGLASPEHAAFVAALAARRQTP